jgi:hypothetical protein
MFTLRLALLLFLILSKFNLMAYILLSYVQNCRFFRRESNTPDFWSDLRHLNLRDQFSGAANHGYQPLGRLEFE